METDSFCTLIPSSYTSINFKNVKIVPVKMTKMTFCFSKKKKITEPDALHPVYNFFQNVNRMGGHPIHISKWKCEPDGTSSGLHCGKKIVNRMGAIRFTISFANVNRMTLHPVYILVFFQNVNWMRGIQFIWSSSSPM